MTRRWGSWAGAFAAVCVCTGAGVLAQQTRRSATDGVYTKEQAQRGEQVAANYCAECHGDTLRGLEGPALAGRTFMSAWGARTVGDLLGRIAETMPKGNVEALKERDRVDVVAYLLQVNQFPAGMTELSADRPSLDLIALSSSTGPIPGALIKTTGCLTPAPDNQWALTGAQPYRLMNVFPRPTAHIGHMVVVTGFFLRTPDGADALNVVTLEGTGDSCR
jgi:mono/diheme cytochrome c family protein